MLLVISALASAAAYAGELRGRVTLEANGGPVANATVLIRQLGLSTQTDAEGGYEFLNLPPGTYEVMAHLHPLADERRRVEIAEDRSATLDFALQIAAVQEQITVTASGREETTLESFQAVTSLDHLELTARSAPSLGEVLENAPGVAKRSSGPGTTRPVVRGFDGDRVLVMLDGMPTGTLSYQSGDHGEPLDATAMERVEVVRGPATLLYGSNAIGGVVNAISSHHQIHQHPHAGLRGRITGLGGTANGMGGGSGSFEFGRGHWTLWGGGGAHRTGDYSTPLGTVLNSGTRVDQASAGAGRFGDKFFGSIGYGMHQGRYGIPLLEDHGHDSHSHGHGDGEPVHLDFRRHNLRFSGGVKNLNSALEQFTLHLGYSDWRHTELEGAEAHNRYHNRQLVWRGVFDQRRWRGLTGRFGFMGARRDYSARGHEVTTPPVAQDALALYGLEEVDLEHVQLQFGGRLERTAYDPAGLRPRAFTGFSGAAGARMPLWEGGVLVAGYNHSYRAPALEELYAMGPHAGNLTWEIGDAGLGRERARGFDLAVRHAASRLRGEVNLFHYRLSDYVYLAPTGQLVDGLIEARYRQGSARYQGAEARLDAGLHGNLWLNLGLDWVRAELADSEMPLPRIPPLRGRIGLDARLGGFSLRPGVVMAGRQDRLFPTETPTAGYSVFNLDASYTVASRRAVHIFGVNAFNLGDRLYRNHLSFIKEYAPEIGRGVRFSYTIQVF